MLLNFTFFLKALVDYDYYDVFLCYLTSHETKNDYTRETNKIFLFLFYFQVPFSSMPFLLGQLSNVET